jgi:hypothetical protein
VEALLVDLEANGVALGDLEWTGQRCHVVGGTFRGLGVVIKLEHAAHSEGSFHNSPMLRTAGVIVTMERRFRKARAFQGTISEAVRVGVGRGRGYFFGHTKRNCNGEFVPFIITQRAPQGCEEVFEMVTKSWTEQGVLLDDLRHRAQDLFLAVRVANENGLYFHELSNESVRWRPVVVDLAASITTGRQEDWRPVVVDLAASITLVPKEGGAKNAENNTPKFLTRLKTQAAPAKLNDQKALKRSNESGGNERVAKKGKTWTAVGFCDSDIEKTFRKFGEKRPGLGRLSTGDYLHADRRPGSKFNNKPTKPVQKRPRKPCVTRQKSVATRLHKASNNSLMPDTVIIDRDVLKRRDAFAVGRLLLRVLAPSGQTEDDRDRWISDAVKAASDPEQMKALLLRGHDADIKQPRALDRWADLLYQLHKVDGAMTAEDALLHPAMSLPILTPSFEEALSSGEEVPIEGGEVLPSWAVFESLPRAVQKLARMRFPELRLALEGDDKGVGLRATGRILEGAPVTWYAGRFVTGDNIHDLPPSRYVLAFSAKYLYCYAEPSRERPVGWYLDNRAGASFMNTSDDREGNNCRLLKLAPVYDDAGNVWILAVAHRDIEPGEFLSHPYDPNAGGGYSFSSG